MNATVEARNRPQEQGATRDIPRAVFAALLVLFLLSGAAGLIYEVAWTRIFTRVFGNTTYGVSAVLTAFMAGLSLGSFWLGRSVDRIGRHILVYALLEIGIGASALLLPLVTDTAYTLYAGIYTEMPSSTWLLQAIRTVISLAYLIVPTFLMGGTFPVITKIVVGQMGEVGWKTGMLYAMNTLGAAIGCFATGFFLIKAFGIHNTILIGVAINFLVGAVCLPIGLLYKKAPPAREDREPVRVAGAGAAPSDAQVVVLLTGVAITGFTALAYEVLWFRLLVFELETTIYAFTVMLTTFLLGIALGSALFAARDRKGSPLHRYWEDFGFVEVAIGFFAIGSIALFGGVDRFTSAFAATFWGRIGIQFAIAATIMALPTLLMGAGFPIACRAYATGVAHIGGSIGRVYAFNTVGAILGAFVTGFVLVRAIGTQSAILLMACLNFCAGTAILLFSPRATPVRTAAGGDAPVKERGAVNVGTVIAVWVMAVVVIAVLPKDILFHYFNVGEKRFDDRVQIIHAEEGLEGITTVHRYPDGTRVISTGSINVAGTSFTLRTTQILQAHIPLLLHPHPKRTLQVGFGSGETAHIVTQYDIEQHDCVEISQAVIDTSDKFFRDINGGVVDDPKFHPIIMDGANYLRLTDQKYDIIMNDSIWPFYAGNSGLYTREYFLAGKQHLNEGGIMTSWLPLEIALEDFETLLNTFHSVFPHVTVWVAITHYNKHALIAGSEQKIEVDLEAFLKRFNEFAKDDLALVNLGDPVDFLDAFKMDESGFGGAVAGAPLHTEDRPVLEFSLSRGKPGEQQPAVYQFIVDHNSGFAPYLTTDAAQAADRDRFTKQLALANAASAHVMRGVIEREGFGRSFRAEVDTALALWPQHPGAKRLKSETAELASLDTRGLKDRSSKDLHLLATELRKSGALQGALQVTLELLRRDPKDTAMLFEVGVLLFETGSYADATDAFRQVLAKQPDHVMAKFNLGRCLAATGSLQEAVDLVGEIVNGEHDFAEAENYYGVLTGEAGDVAGAVGHFRKAVDLKPDYPEAHKNLGVALSKLNRDAEALVYYRRALQLKPDDATYHDAYGVSLAKQGMAAEAQEQFTAATTIDPKLVQAHMHLAQLYYLNKEFARALEQVEVLKGLGQEVPEQFVASLKEQLAAQSANQ